MRLNLPPTRLRFFSQERETLRLGRLRVVKKSSLAPMLRRGVASKDNNPLFRGFRLKNVETFFLNLEAIGFPPLFAAPFMRVAQA